MKTATILRCIEWNDAGWRKQPVRQYLSMTAT